MDFSYGQVEDMIAALHHVQADRRGALSGRIKHFQRLGWPTGAKPGKGARVRYGVHEALKLAASFELLQIGLAPERIVEALTVRKARLAGGFLKAGQQIGVEGSDQTLIAIDPQALAPLTVPQMVSVTGIYPGVEAVSASELTRDGWLSSRRRVAIVNATRLIIDVMALLAIELSALQEQLQNWVIAEGPIEHGPPVEFYQLG